MYKSGNDKPPTVKHVVKAFSGAHMFYSRVLKLLVVFLRNGQGKQPRASSPTPTDELVRFYGEKEGGGEKLNQNKS